MLSSQIVDFAHGLKFAILAHLTTSRKRQLSFVTVLLFAFLVKWRVAPAYASYLATNLPVPVQEDWIDYGPIFESGELGEWDYILSGGFAGTIVKKDDVYHLYYQGISGYRVVPDETVMWRSIGAASSPDGINFTKHSENPILTWFPHNNGEEGAVSGGVATDSNGDIIMYYGANTEESSQLINADGRIATSTDGVTFVDQGIVLDHGNSALWGSGDEIFPIITIQDNGKWYVYYIPNGTSQTHKLGVAWGNNRMNLNNSAAATSGGSTINAWGMGGSAKIGPDTYALFINDVTQSTIEVRTVSLAAPNQLSAPLETYQFDGIQQATIFLDEARNTWFLYYRADDHYGVKLAPVGAPDSTPPTPPNSVNVTPLSDQENKISWNPANDQETGIVSYRVFRDGTPIATVKGWHFNDTGLIEQTEYTYQVSAINYHGYEGPKSAPISNTTPADETPPGIAYINSDSDPAQLTLVFDEPIDESSAEASGNYTVAPGISVVSATLQPDLKTVILTTSDHVEGVYNITVNNVKDRAAAPNATLPNTSAGYIVTLIPGLVGSWTLDEVAGATAYDTANYGNDGTRIYTNLPGPSSTIGQIGSALYFDGIDDQVTFPGTGMLENVTDDSHTFSVWVQPDSVPSGSTANNTTYSILVRKYTGLYFDMNRKFRAAIRLTDGSEVDLTSSVVAAGSWYHLTMVVDDASKRLHFYVNGVEVSGSPANYNGTLADHEDAPYYLGASEPLTNFYEYRFHGIIDEARIFQQPLTPPEVQSLYAWSPDNVAPVSVSFVASVTNGFAPHTAQFSNTSTGSYTTSQWGFGDDAISTQQSPDHTYLAAGNFSVSLEVAGPGGSGTFTQTNAIQVEFPPEITPVRDGITLHLAWYGELESTDYEVWQSADPYFVPGESGAVLLAQIEPDAEGGNLTFDTPIGSVNLFYRVKAIQGSADMASDGAGVFQYELVSTAAPSSTVEEDASHNGEFVDWQRR